MSRRRSHGTICSPPPEHAGSWSEGSKWPGKKYAKAFKKVAADIKQAPGMPPILVAGFTELVSPGAWNLLVPMLKTLSDRQVKFQPPFSIKCGQTALGKPEYIGIAVARACKIVGFGRFVQSSERTPNGGLKFVHDIKPANVPRPVWSRQTPPKTTADSRALVYVVVDIPGHGHCAFGFLHNMFHLNEAHRVFTMNSLPNFAQKIMDEHARCSQVIVGGDFNSRPRRLRTRSLELETEAVGITAVRRDYRLELRKRNRPVRVGGTTQGGNLYDYWQTYNVNSIPLAHSWTMNSYIGLSDHACSALRVV